MQKKTVNIFCRCRRIMCSTNKLSFVDCQTFIIHHYSWKCT